MRICWSKVSVCHDFISLRVHLHAVRLILNSLAPKVMKHIANRTGGPFQEIIDAFLHLAVVHVYTVVSSDLRIWHIGLRFDCRQALKLLCLYIPPTCYC
jgi:hypothetical protein